MIKTRTNRHPTQDKTVKNGHRAPAQLRASSRPSLRVSSLQKKKETDEHINFVMFCMEIFLSQGFCIEIVPSSMFCMEIVLSLGFAFKLC